MSIGNYALNNKYTRWYINICESAKFRARTRYEAKKILGHVEGHHVLPKCIRKNDEIVYLSPREHFIVHWLLTKMFDGLIKSKMFYAMTCMAMKRKKYLTSRQIAVCMSFKHTPCSDERAKNISSGRLLTTKITCEHCNVSCDPGNYTQFHGDKCKHNPMISSEIIDERKQRARRSMKLQKERGTWSKPISPVGPFTCPHCGKIGMNHGAMKRHHFDRCRSISSHSSSLIESIVCS